MPFFRLLTRSSDVSKTEHIANDLCCCIIEFTCTYCSPAATVKHLKSSFSWIAASIQSNFDLSASTGDSDVFTVLTVVNAPAVV